MSNKKHGLIILGASGGVGQSFLKLIAKYRNYFSSVVLIDRDDSITKSKFISHDTLDYIFLQRTITNENITDILSEIAKEHNSTIVLDVTDYDTKPILSAANSLHLSYLNCSFNDMDSDSMKGFLNSVKVFSEKYNNTSHILSLGMNPGVVNHLIIKGVLEEGIPNDFVEIEYDSGRPTKDRGTPFIGWSKKQFLNEAVWDKTSFCGKDGKYVQVEEPAIFCLENTEEYIKPIKKMSEYPMGMIVAHDEIITMSNQLEIPGKFVYSIHPTSLKRLQDLAKKGDIEEKDIIFMDNVNLAVEGSDFIGVWLNYHDKRVCYYVEVEHPSVEGSNATLYLVAIGVLAGLLSFIEKPINENGVFSVSILNNDNYIDILSRYITVNKIVSKD